MLRYIGLFIVFSLLPGCNSFHLRGSVTLPPAMQPAAIQATDPYSDFVAELRRTLSASGVALIAQREQAQLTINIIKEKRHRRILSVGGTGKVQEYALHYHVEFSLLKKGVAQPAEIKTINLVRDYLFDAADVLGQSQQESLLRKDMERDAVQLILRYIEATVST